MTYGVVLCPSCKRPRGVDLKGKMATCICGKRLNLQGLRVIYRTDDRGQLSAAIGRISARLEGREEEFVEELQAGHALEDIEHWSPAPAAPDLGDRGRVVVVLRDLTDRLGSFTLEDLRRAFEGTGLGDPEPWVSRLLRENVIYEPRRGTYSMA
jgi:hypothetical protein